MNSGLWRGEIPSLRKFRPISKDTLEPTDHQPLQEQLGCDAQLQIAVERVVVGHEWAGVGTAGPVLQQRRLDFDERPGGHERAQRRDDRAPGFQRSSSCGVCPQVELPTANARLDVIDASLRVGERMAGAREHVDRADADAAVPGPGGRHRSGDPDPIAEGGAGSRLLERLVVVGDELNDAGAVVKVGEQHTSEVTSSTQPTRHDDRCAVGQVGDISSVVRGSISVRDRGGARVGGVDRHGSGSSSLGSLSMTGGSGRR